MAEVFAALSIDIFKAYVDKARGTAFENLDAWLSLDKKKRKMENEQAQRLFQAVMDHVLQTSGRQKLKEGAVLESCGSPVAGFEIDGPLPTGAPGVLLSQLDEAMGSDYVLLDAGCALGLVALDTLLDTPLDIPLEVQLGK